MRKRDSLRRWKARCRIGRVIPEIAIETYRLRRWFWFLPAGNPMLDFYTAHPLPHSTA